VASRIGGVRGAAERGVGRRANASRLRASVLGLVLACGAATGCITLDLPFGGPGELQETVVAGTGGPKLLMIDIAGVISEDDEAGSFGIGGRESAIARMREQLERAREDAEVKGILLRIASPGGTVTASDVLYHELARFKAETKRPMLAVCMGVCASGAYYAAMAADRVVAHPTSVVGSIGVIFSGLSIAGLMERWGVENQTITSGAFKDTGTFLRRMRPDERAQLQSVIDDMYARFLEVVGKGRPNLDAEKIRRLADGRVYSARQAQAEGLVDEIAYLPDAAAELAKRAGLTEARVVVYHRAREFRENVYSASPAPEPHAAAGGAGALRTALPEPTFLYLWSPGLQ
jgi:protease IV